ncbi:hypothetical protein Tco_0426326 [Tanacetum coccineum]
MRTRSQSRRRRQNLPVEPIVEQNVVPNADNRTMAQCLQAPIEGYEDAIVVPPINANNFELKQPLINLVQSNKFMGRQDPTITSDFLNKVTSMFSHQRSGTLRKAFAFSFFYRTVEAEGIADPRVPLILGRPFLRTAHALIDVYEGTSNDDDEPVSLPVFNAKHTMIPRVTFLFSRHLSTMIITSLKHGDYLPELQKDLKVVEPQKSLVEYATSYEPNDEIPKVELKELPLHLEYAFLEGNNKLPVIISKDLSLEEKTSLINVLKNQKQAIAWKLSDIRGIDPDFASHKILFRKILPT